MKGPKRPVFKPNIVPPQSGHPQSQVKPRPKYWDDPVYHHVAKRNRVALTHSYVAEVEKTSQLMHLLSTGALSEKDYLSLEVERKLAEEQEKAERKKAAKGFKPSSHEKQPEARLNVEALKKRVFNPQVSPANMIEAMDALPREVRREVAAHLTPFLRSKIAKYLAQHNL